MRDAIHNPIEMHEAGTVVTASLLVALGATALVTVVKAPGLLVALAAVALAATTRYRLEAIHARQTTRTREGNIPTTDTRIDV